MKKIGGFYSERIKRAMIACENSGHSVENDFPEVRKIVDAGIAKDFKVREEYIAPNGKTHSIAPRKKKAKGRVEK